MPRDIIKYLNLKKSTRKKVEYAFDLNEGISSMLDSLGLKSKEDILKAAASCCLQGCECCVQISKTANRAVINYK